MDVKCKGTLWRDEYFQERRNMVTAKSAEEIPKRLLVLACAVMEREIRQFQNGRAEFRFFDYGLHRTPENMAQTLQIEIDQAAKEEYDGIVLGYGLCSNGIVGISSRKQPLIIPRIHDCISLFLGSSESYRDQTARQPGTYYLTSGWIEKGQTPLSKYEDYSRSYDRETAMWVLKEEMKHYTRIALINNGVADLSTYRNYARRNADLLGLQYEELQGSLSFFKKLLWGPWDKDFLVIEKDQSVFQDIFMES
ncbi:MAG: DUF1638 domain-containing protein [Thermodesulfobacteriota bacterium]|nr:DUF1638 domain-containing protein [Thermodesulfobacteriota bacterium]